MRAGLHGKLVINIGGGDFGVGGHRHQVADLLHKAAVASHIGNDARVGAVPSIEFSLQAFALGQQGGVFGCKVGHNAVKTLPERILLHTNIGQHFAVDKVVQGSINLQRMNGGALCHGTGLFKKVLLTQSALRAGYGHTPACY